MRAARGFGLLEHLELDIVEAIRLHGSRVPLSRESDERLREPARTEA
jgi:hypothetical protein